VCCMGGRICCTRGGASQVVGVLVMSSFVSWNTPTYVVVEDACEVHVCVSPWSADGQAFGRWYDSEAEYLILN
jgi:hypothetical protein